jgi:hypothetical protein
MHQGYDRPLYILILPFDHRNSFQAKMFGLKPPLSEAQTAEIVRTSLFHGGLNYAAWNDWPWPNGSEYGSPAVEGWPSMRGV